MSHSDLIVQSMDGTTESGISDASAGVGVSDMSRAQLVSSDINRQPRRPSMSLEPDHRELSNARARRESHLVPPRIDETHRLSVGHGRRENGHVHRPSVDHNNRDLYERQENQTVRSHRIGSLRDFHPENVRRRDFQGVSSARTRSSNISAEDKDDRYVVPALPMPLAVLCCILNFLVPGLGSMAASVCVFCCAKTDDMTCGEKWGSCCTVFGIGVLQLLLVGCFLIGWIWSCIWGVTFIAMSDSYYNADIVDDPDDLYNNYSNSGGTNNPMYQRSQRGRTPLPAPQVVVDQPYPGIHYEDLRRERYRRREAQRRSRSRISLTPSNLIYPMRAPSNIAYNSPPPPYRATVTPTGDDIAARQQRQSSEVIPEEGLRR